MLNIRVTLCTLLAPIYSCLSSQCLFVQRQQQPGTSTSLIQGKPILVPYGQDAAQGTLPAASTVQHRAVLWQRASS